MTSLSTSQGKNKVWNEDGEDRKRRKRGNNSIIILGRRKEWQGCRTADKEVWCMESEDLGKTVTHRVKGKLSRKQGLVCSTPYRSHGINCTSAPLHTRGEREWHTVAERLFCRSCHGQSSLKRLKSFQWIPLFRGFELNRSRNLTEQIDAHVSTSQHIL